MENKGIIWQYSAIHKVLITSFIFLIPTYGIEPHTNLPSPLKFEDIPSLAQEKRAEIRAAQERISAAQERESIVSALDDPTISPSIDHWPFGMPEADISIGIEQRFPLSRILGQKKQSAQAQTRFIRSEMERTTQNVLVDATNAFLMLYDRRAMAQILKQQQRLVSEIIAAVNARYSSGSNSTQAEVIQAEIELARVNSRLESIYSEIKGAEAMLNTSLGRASDLPIPELLFTVTNLDTFNRQSSIQTALQKRPELIGGRAELERAGAEISVMQSMFLPMIMVRAGPAYTMDEGPGLMLMISSSIPIWRKKLHAGVAEAKAMERMARADLNAMERMVEGEAANAYSRLEASRTQFIALKTDILPRARQNIEPSLSGYAAGLLPLVSVIEAIRMLLMTQEELVSAEVTVGTAWITLKRAIGTLEGWDK